VRDYIHVIDLAAAHVLALAALERRRDGASPRAYNLGCGGDGYTVNEVVETAARITGRQIPVRWGQRRAGDPAALVASSDRIRDELGWTPRHAGLESIISSAWRWMSGHAAAVGGARQA
jgi:UDP-glucose 4-epimerase